MRQDIEIHINTGDIVLNSHNKVLLYPFAWVDNPTGLSRYIYGEITVPNAVSEQSLLSHGVSAMIPYTPIYQEFYVRFKRQFEGGSYDYVQNPTDGSCWFLVKTGLYGGVLKNVYASQLSTISISSFYFKIEKESVRLYSSDKSDVNIVAANRQNSNMLLKCIPTNNYRYPLSGVGLIRWKGGNIDYTQLSETLQSEFKDDGVIVRNASFDFNTDDLYLDLDTTNADK